MAFSRPAISGVGDSGCDLSQAHSLTAGTALGPFTGGRRPSGADQRKVEIDNALREFARGLRAYTWEDSSEVNDRKVRQSWAKIEDILVSLKAS